MKIEIWSDVMCPFCYIGKRRFEQALETFEHRDEIEVEWKSFQLNPDLQTDANIRADEYLAEKKGISIGQAQEMNNYVTRMAAEAGLTYHLDRAIVANSFNAHRLSHLAKVNNRGDQMEEHLFRAYFTEGKNIDDPETLRQLGIGAGLDSVDIDMLLQSDAYAGDVKHDIAEAQYLGIQGVPFFVMDNKYAISGAQAVPVFTQTLNKAFSEWQQNQLTRPLEITDGDSCDLDGNC